MPPLKKGRHFALLLSICLCRFICRSLILLRLLVLKVSMLFSSVLVSFQVSHPCSNMDKTRLLKRETLVFLPISMAFPMLSSLLKDVPAIAILFLVSAMLSPPFVTLAPRYIRSCQLLLLHYFQPSG